MKEIKALRFLEVPPLGSEFTVSDGPETLEIIVTGE
jgi:hypothetical protein